MDKGVIQNIINGDKEAFKQLYDEHFDRALRSAAAITRNKETAKDAVQEAFIRVYLNLSSYDINKPFEPWFYRILINECNRILKKGSALLLVDPPLLEDVMIDPVAKETFSDLHEMILSLEDLYRIPVVLKYLQGFAEKEIAHILDLNLNTVKSRLYKGREKLKAALETIENGREKYE
ncbi:RNA polymerase subunit sigma-24 [Geosporobacter ferrireducens]|uniref:RNA polymerase subunit sigma-24 n=2 Tax=Geosporobacter ferrireducens TaxID=1424294 RepID=A0A1D8GDD0_9FIRM|nr:RNA polymerase subunit sigma-24 [Geosporobacter ferrireducens]MTI54841.1 sigma-70 family RNA polymerase sigma factor [Geosporobacter ferrireducens]